MTILILISVLVLVLVPVPDLDLDLKNLEQKDLHLLASYQIVASLYPSPLVSSSTSHTILETHPGCYDGCTMDCSSVAESILV